jgi:hypothetical protein
VKSLAKPKSIVKASITANAFLLFIAYPFLARGTAAIKPIATI